MARRTPPTAPAPAAPPPVPRLPSPTERWRSITAARRSGRGVTTVDIDVDAERDTEGSLPEQLTVEHSDERSPEREEAERALEALEALDEDDDEQIAP